MVEVVMNRGETLGDPRVGSGSVDRKRDSWFPDHVTNLQIHCRACNQKSIAPQQKPGWCGVRRSVLAQGRQPHTSSVSNSHDLSIGYPRSIIEYTNLTQKVPSRNNPHPGPIAGPRFLYPPLEGALPRSFSVNHRRRASTTPHPDNWLSALTCAVR